MNLISDMPLCLFPGFPSLHPRTLLLLAGLLFLAGPAALTAADGVIGPRTGQWAHAESSLKPDPKVTWGRLDNGFRYALLPHQGVPGRVSAQLLVFAGSLDELDDERGIAHYTEHMVFRQTKNFTFEEKLRFFQALGMEFGSDVNAVTTHDRTFYMLDFHEATPELLGRGLLVLRDFADGALFLPEEVNRERGVVLSEMRDRTNLGSSTMDRTMPLIFKGLTYPHRNPIGTRETLQSFQQEHFRRFYERCYRADLMVLVMTGDFEPAQMTSLVRERFGDIRKPMTPVPPRLEGRLDTSRGLRAGLFAISGVGGASAQVACVTPVADKPDSAEARAETIRRTFAMSIVGDRLRAAAGPAAGEAQYLEMLGHGIVAISAQISPDTWARDLGVLDDLIRFTAQKGFEQREVDAVMRRYSTANSYLLEQKDTIDPKYLNDNLATSIAEHKVYTGFDHAQRSVRDTLATINPRNLAQSFQSCWDLERMVYHLAGEVMIEGGATEVVKKVQEARRGGLRSFRPDTRRETVFELKKWGKPAEVIESRAVPEVGAKLYRYGNNLHVNFVRNRAAAGLVHVVARFGTGLLDLPPGKPALKDFGLRTLLSSGSAHYSPEFISKVYEDHLTYLGFDVSDQDAFAFRAGATAEKIEIPLGIITDFLSHPLFNTATHREVKFNAFIERSLNSFSLQEAMRQMHNHLFRGDARLTSGGPNDYIGLSAVDVRDWLEEPLKRGYLEVTIVGDISEEAMLRAVERTLACLPMRDAKKQSFSAPKPVKVVARPGFQRIEFVGEQNMALVIGTWPVQAKLSTRDEVALSILSRVLQDRVRMRLRSDLGLSYSPGASFEPFNGFGDFGMVQAFVQCAPDDSTKIAGLVDEIGAELARDGIPEAEFTGTQHLLLSQMREWFRDDEFLLSMLKRAQEKPETLDEVLRLKAGLTGEINLEEVNGWAEKVLNSRNSRTAAIVPKPFIGIFTPTN